MDDLLSKLDQYWELASGWREVILVFTIVFAAMLTNFIVKRSLTRMLVAAATTESIWDDALLRAAYRPVRLLVWVLGLALAVRMVLLDVGSTLIAFVDVVRDVGVIASVTWLLMRVVSEVEANIMLQHAADVGGGIDRTTADAVAKLLRISIVITGALIAIQTLGFSVSGVLAFGGVGGIAVGFASRDLLANFFGGLTVYLDRPFAVGDWVRSPDRDIEGTVEAIGWRTTLIRTFDMRPLYVPNSAFTTIAVENPSRMLNRRIYETIGLRYDDLASIAGITEEIRGYLRSNPEIDVDRTLMVNLNEFSPSSLDFFIYCFTRTTDWVRFHEIKQEVLLAIAAIIEERGAEMAYPTQVLHVSDAIRVVGASQDD
jgi:MscS family membrane protein